MNPPAPVSDDREMLLGLLDAVYALGITLTAAGVLTREQLTAAMGEVVAQQQARGAPLTRQCAASALHAAFSSPQPVKDGDDKPRFAVIAGGRV